MHKTDLLHAIRPAPAWPAVQGEITLRAPRKPGAPAVPGIQNDLAQLARAHHKRVVFLEFEWTQPVNDDEAAAFNAAFAPYAETVIVHVPPAMTFDGQHLMPAAAAQVASALIRHEAAR
jgi:hypothetical protein